MIDRADCIAKRHGTSNAYMNHRCRCPDARDAQRIYVKKRKLARLRGQLGRPDMVPTWRVKRRVQALARMGYASREVQRAAWGYDLGSGTGSWASRSSMTAGRFAALDAVYQRWSAVRGTNERARWHAERMNFAAPLDWDNIDDPDEVPHNQCPEGLEQRRLAAERERDRNRGKTRWARRQEAMA